MGRELQKVWVEITKNGSKIEYEIEYFKGSPKKLLSFKSQLGNVAKFEEGGTEIPPKL